MHVREKEKWLETMKFDEGKIMDLKKKKKKGGGGLRAATQYK